jgi:PAS domain S-box-containing protein
LGDWPGIIFAHSPVACCLIDLNGVLTDVSQAAARLFGHTREVLRRKKLSELGVITPDQFAKVDSSVNNWKRAS